MCDGALAFSERPDQTSGPALAPMGLRVLLVLVMTAVITSLGFSVISLSPASGQASRAAATSPTHPR